MEETRVAATYIEEEDEGSSPRFRNNTILTQASLERTFVSPAGAAV
jgi:hypothetical protein